MVHVTGGEGGGLPRVALFIRPRESKSGGRNPTAPPGVRTRGSGGSRLLWGDPHGLPCNPGAAWAWLLERAERMLSGVISTLERMLAKGLGEAPRGPIPGVFKPPMREEGLVGVLGEGLEAGLTPGGRDGGRGEPFWSRSQLKGFCPAFRDPPQRPGR